MTKDLGERVFACLNDINEVQLEPDTYDTDAGYHLRIHDSSDMSVLDLSIGVDVYNEGVVNGTILHDTVYEFDRSDLGAVTTGDFTYHLLEDYAQRLNNAMIASNNLQGLSVELFDEEEIIDVHDPSSAYLVVGTVEIDDTVRQEELKQLITKVEFTQDRLENWYDTLSV